MREVRCRADGPANTVTLRKVATVLTQKVELRLCFDDREQRLPIGRLWITLAIDVYSRMVVGFCISLDPPGAISTGLCIAYAVLPKDAWLEHRALSANGLDSTRPS